MFAAGAVHRRDDPFRRALLDGVDGVAGDRLEHLRQHAIRVAREQIPQADRFQLGRVQHADPQPHKRAAEFHRDA